MALPYGRQSIDEDDIAAVAQALRSDFLTTGPKVAEFEAALCAVTGAPHAVACGNGTQALHLAALAADVGPGDVVVVPTLTFLATANAARYCGADVIFSDVDPQTGLMRPEDLETALVRCPKTPKAVFPVHLNGQPVDLKAIREICAPRGITVVADACHALGGAYQGRSIGSCADEDLSVFSFHPVKTIAMGEGGAITARDPEQARRMRTLRSHGMVKTPEQGLWAYEMPELGYNYRVPDILCALGLSQLKKLERFVAKRKALSDLYNTLLEPLAPLVTPVGRVSHPVDPAWHLYAVLIDFDVAGLDRSRVMQGLLDREVGSQVHYIPVHTQPYYRKLYGDQDLPGAQKYYARVLSLPLYVDMEESDVRHVVEALADVMKGRGV